MTEYISNKTIEKLKHDLVRDGFISIEDLNKAEEIAMQNKKNLAYVIIEENFIPEEILLKFIQDNLHIPYVNLEDYAVDEKCLGFISAEEAKKFRILPLFKIENTLTVAMPDPLDLFSLNNMVKCLKCQIEPVICSENQVHEAIEKYYYQEESLNQVLNTDWAEATSETTILNSIFQQAIQSDTFEIILEDLVVKFRKTNSIETRGKIPKLIEPLVISYIKRQAGLDINIFNVPQLGKFKYQNLLVVVSTFPFTFGERIAMKLYKPPSTIKELQMDVDLEKPGLILITGPELSGKSFVAYSILNSINAEAKNTMTLESIAKYDIKGVVQCELNEKVGFNIEKALRFIDFQSPDIIYIEDIPPENLLKIIANDRVIITETKQTIIPESLKALINCIIYVKSVNEIEVRNF